jgi:hypothetical protein
MITPKLTAVLVAMTALVGAGPVAVFGQAAAPMDPADETDTDTAVNEFLVSNTIANVADTSADDNTQINNAEVDQEQSGEAECDDDCSASVFDLTQISNVEQENEIETGDVDQEANDNEQSNELDEILAIALADLDLS